MTRLERYKQKLEEIKAKRNRLLRSYNLVKASALNAEIEEIEKLIGEAEQYEAKPIRELLTREQIQESGFVAALIECHIAADFLAYCTYNVEDILKRFGMHAVTMLPDLKEIRKRCDDFAARMYGMNEDLDNLITDDETLMEAMHKKACSYITQRLKN